MAECIENYITEEYSIAHLKRFSQYIITNELSCDLKDRVSIKCSLMPLPGNGYVRARRLEEGYRYHIRINLLPFLMGKFTSNRMRLFYLYVTIVHELHHVHLLECKKVETYSELMAFWEEYRSFSRLRLMDGIGMLLMRKKAAATRRNKYRASVAETMCNLAGFEKSYKVLGAYLSQSETENVNKIIESLKFLQNHISVTYGHGNQPYNLFTKMVREVQPLLKKDPHELSGTLKPMMYLFSPEGHVKSVEQLFAERTDENEQIIDGLLTHWFICADMVFSPIFERDPTLKNHLETLANRYCAGVIQYLKNIEIGEIFLDKEILQDNAAMLVKNVDRLNKLMAHYDMIHFQGSVIPLYYTGK